MPHSDKSFFKLPLCEFFPLILRCFQCLSVIMNFMITFETRFSNVQWKIFYRYLN